MTLGIGAATEAPERFSLNFVVEGEPIPKARPRITRNGSYTPPKTKAYQKRLAQVGKLAMRGDPVTTALVVTVEACLPIPQSWAARQRQHACAGVKMPDGGKTGDADNYLKSVMDGLNGIVWRDDSQIVQATVTKRYSARPLMRIMVEEWRG